MLFAKGRLWHGALIFPLSLLRQSGGAAAGGRGLSLLLRQAHDRPAVQPLAPGAKLYAVCMGGEPAETHLPRVRLQGDTVTVEVGAQPHPSLPEHRILWILLQTRYGGQYRLLPPAGPPRAVFRLEGDFPVAAYAFCSRDGLWRAEV